MGGSKLGDGAVRAVCKSVQGQT